MKFARLLAALLCVFALSSSALAQRRVSVSGYYRSNGTYVSPHTRSYPGSSGWTNMQTNYDYNSSRISAYAQPPLQWIDSYFRQDGTYVSGHYKTMADGILENNLSYRGPAAGGSYGGSGTGDPNVTNELSGDLGSFVPTTYETAFPIVRPKNASDAKARREAALELVSFNIKVDWQRHSLVDLLSFQVRASKARELERLGVRVDWREKTYDELDDLLCGARLRQELQASGVGIAQSATCAELEAIRKRVKIANQLAALGKQVDWIKYDEDALEELLEKHQVR